MPEQTAVYRLYDAADVLLYVGVSNHFGIRWDRHARMQPWWPDVDHQTVRWHSSRENALSAEKIAIREEAPIHNIRDSPWEKHVRDDGTGFYVVPKGSEEKIPIPDGIGIEEARSQFGGIVDRVRRAGEHVVLTRYGKQAAVLVPADWYQHGTAAQEIAEALYKEAIADYDQPDGKVVRIHFSQIAPIVARVLKGETSQ